MRSMSSPKRAAKPVAKTVHKTVVKTVAKTVGKPAAGGAAKPDVKVVDGASAEAKRLAAVIERSIVDGKLDLVSAEALQKLMAAACRLYTARAEAGEQFTPVSRNSISATDIMVTASGLLRAADLAVFELGMWQSWTGR
jgi:hydroxymethylglutaryl-CoA reductase